jgi:hypothetical protein
VKHCCDWFEQSEKEETTREVRNEETQTQNRKRGKQNETEQNGRKPKRREHRKTNEFLTLPAKSMNLVEVASARRTRRLISHFPNDFRVLDNERVPGNCLLLSSGFGFPSLAPLCSCSVVSVVISSQTFINKSTRKDFRNNVL